jgi:hypothetical protein
MESGGGGNAPDRSAPGDVAAGPTAHERASRLGLPGNQAAPRSATAVREYLEQYLNDPGDAGTSERLTDVQLESYLLAVEIATDEELARSSMSEAGGVVFADGDLEAMLERCPRVMASDIGDSSGSEEDPDTESSDDDDADAPVFVLKCASCDGLVCRRGIQVHLISDNSRMFSTDLLSCWMDDRGNVCRPPTILPPLPARYTLCTYGGSYRAGAAACIQTPLPVRYTPCTYGWAYLTGREGGPSLCVVRRRHHPRHLRVPDPQVPAIKGYTIPYTILYLLYPFVDILPCEIRHV